MTSPKIDFAKLDRIFLKNYQSLQKKEEKILKKYTFSPLGFSMVLPLKWRVQQGSQLVRMGSSVGKISLFSLPAPSAKLDILVREAMAQHRLVNPSFHLQSKKIFSNMAQIKGWGRQKAIIQQFYHWQGRVFVITAFYSIHSQKGQDEIEQILGSSKFGK